MSDDSGSESDSDSDSSGYSSDDSLPKLPGKNPVIETGMPAELKMDMSVTNAKRAGTKFVPKESNNTTLFMINSRDRDTRIYPQPTYFTIRLPRVFRNIKTVNISQLNLLNSFFNFADAKSNTSMYVYEQGRVTTDVSGATVPNSIKIQVRNGTYSSDDLVTELTNALNSTPLFADISLGEFIDYFQTTGDFTVLFNTPGPVVYNSLTQTYDRNKTINDIVARYFQVVQNVGTVSYTYNECLVSYYYPILKEMLLDSTAPSIEYTESVPPGFSSWYDYIVFAFQGLNDSYITPILLNTSNQAILNKYRIQRTFTNFLVNKYSCTYNTKQGRLVITSPSLNDSIQTDLNTQYNQYLNALVLSNGGFASVNDFQTRYNSINNSNGALIEFYNFIQARFTSNFGVDFGRYSAEFYGDSNNEINIYNILNKYGWNLALTPQVSANTITSNAIADQCPNFWSNIVVHQSNVPTEQFISTIGIPEFANNELYFSNAGESQYGYTDVYFPIQPTTYTRTVFNTRCRQNISIMTLPRVMDKRDASTDMVYDLGSTITQTPLLYKFDGPTGTDMSILTDITDNPLLNMYTVKQHMFQSADYMRAYNHWLEYITPQILAGTRIQPGNQNWNQRPPLVDISLTSYRTSIYFQVDADKYLVEPSAHFNVKFTAETQTGVNFPVPVKVTWYKDRAGFMADVATDNTAGQENPRHYFQTQTYGTDLSGACMIIDVNNSQQTYFMVQFADLSNIPSAIPLRVFAELKDAYGVYTIKQVTDTYDMPYKDLPSLSDQYTPASDVFKNPTRSIYDSNIFQFGYDISGVSNNLLDYIIQAGNGNYYDPNNITDYLNGVSTGLRYQMNLNTNGSAQPLPSISTNWSLFFDKNSSNLIRDTYNTTKNVYLGAGVAQKPLDPNYGNEHTIANWFQAGNPNLVERFLTPNISESYHTKISTSSVFLPIINPANPLLTDSYTSDASYAQDVSGVCGISFFMPPNNIVKMNSILINFAYTQPSDIGAISYNRQNSPLGLGGQEFNNSAYHNQTTDVLTQTSTPDDWDDWYVYNRRNTKLAIFRSGDVHNKTINDMSLSNAICTMTLEKVTQVANYQSQLGTLRTREPGWGTYYTYKFDPRSVGVWDVDMSVPESSWTTSTIWRSTITSADYAPTYVAGDTSYPNYFLTPENIYNYTYLSRSYGIAPAVGTAVYYPELISTAISDIPNSFTAVPFYNDPVTNTWKVGSFYGLSYTQEPALPSNKVIGAAPYYGPPGIFGFTNVNGTFQLHNGQQPSGFETFYWNTKIQYETLDLEYNPATDLAKFGGFNGVKKEYQDTVMFFYKNKQIGEDYKDVSTVTSDVQMGTQYFWNWGMEKNTNYNAYDDQSGYNYLSYIHSIPVRPSTKEYAVHVRAYDPIPRFQTGLRFIGKNYTDFGRPTLWEIANEISSLGNYRPISDSNASLYINELINTKRPYTYASTIKINEQYRISTSGNYFSHEYADALINFNMMFSTSVTFGKKIGYTGKQFELYGYQDSVEKYIEFFSSIRGIYTTYTTILSTATGQLNTYVNTRYKNVLPSTIINRNRITDPLPFQFMFQSKLEPPYDTQFDEWGLGWNLGFNKVDTLPRTTVTSDTFIRITQDYVYLRLNPEYNMNTMGVSGKECRGCCQESTGQDKKYFSKIILNNFGGFCRTAIQLPKEFNPILGKYDTISCQLVDKYGNQINNSDCEYDFVLDITEVTNGPDGGASLQGIEADLAIYASEK